MSAYQWFLIAGWLVVLPAVLGWALSAPRTEHHALGLVLVCLVPFIFFLILGAVARYWWPA